MTVDEASGPPVEIWPDNVMATEVFIAMTTQWVIGPAGAVGFNYSSLAEVWRRLKVPPSMRDGVFHDLQVMEGAALKKMREK